MNRQKILLSLTVFLLSCASMQAQITQRAKHNEPGTPGFCSQERVSQDNPSPLNGSGSLGQTYELTKCGLNYTTANQRLGQRFTPAGVAQPATFSISGITSGATIEKAYLWTSVGGNGTAITATVKNPSNVTTNYGMTQIGSGPDRCWQFSGCYTYRADVTSSISGNGNYLVSGLPTTTTPGTSSNDADGALLMVIYSDPCASYRGTIAISDGMVERSGGTINQSISFGAACANGSSARAFGCFGDMQYAPSTFTMNGVNIMASPPTWNFWHYIDVSTSITSGQTTSNTTIVSNGDCYSMSMRGVYYRTNCVSCSGFTLSANYSCPFSNICLCSGTATVTGGTGPFTYLWMPGGYTTATTPYALCPGIYTVTVTNGSCTRQATISIPGARLAADGHAMEDIPEDFNMNLPQNISPGSTQWPDQLKPEFIGGEPQRFEMRVYNLLGEELFSSTDPSMGWNGGEAPPGIYICKIMLTTPAGYQKQYNQRVVLMR